jgi:hypothetical protein
MPIGTGELEDRFGVPIESQPLQSVENGVDGGLGRTGAIRVFDTQKELSTVVSSEQPIEQRGTGAANMQEASGGGGETSDDGHNDPKNLMIRQCDRCLSVAYSYRRCSMGIKSS